jgi:hypothetical protein
VLSWGGEHDGRGARSLAWVSRKESAFYGWKAKKAAFEAVLESFKSKPVKRAET